MIVLNIGDKITGISSVASSIDYTIHGVASTGILTQFASGQLSSTESILYTSIGNETVISTIILVNQSESSIITNLYFQPSSGTSHQIIPNNIELKAGYSLHWSGDKITVMATDGSLASSTSGTSGVSGVGGSVGEDGTSGTSGTSGAAGASGGDYVSTDIITDTTFYLATTGSDSNSGTSSSPWYSLSAAFTYLKDKRISGNATVTIQLADGTYNYSTQQICNHQNGDRIEIKGQNVYTKTMGLITDSGTVATPASSNLVQATIVCNVSNISVNDYALIKLNILHVPGHLNGVFKVTYVGSSYITVTATYRGGSSIPNNIVPVAGAAGTLTIIKSIIHFTTTVGEINISGTNNLGSESNYGIDRLVVTKTFSSPSDDVTHIAIHVNQHSSLYCGSYVGVADAYYGIRTIDSSYIDAKKVYVTGCHYGLTSTNGSNLGYSGAVISGCIHGIIVCRTSNAHYCLTRELTDSDDTLFVCTTNGISAWEFSDVICSRIYCNNCNIGIYTTHSGNILLYNSSILNSSYGCHISQHSNLAVSSDTIISNSIIGIYTQTHSHVKGASALAFSGCGTPTTPVIGAGLTADGTYLA